MAKFSWASYEGILGKGIAAPIILILDTRRRWGVSFTLLQTFCEWRTASVHWIGVCLDTLKKRRISGLCPDSKHDCSVRGLEISFVVSKTEDAVVQTRLLHFIVLWLEGLTMRQAWCCSSVRCILVKHKNNKTPTDYF